MLDHVPAFSRLRQVNVVIQECFGCDGKLFGSAVNGFELATSDLDVVVPRAW